MSRCRRCDFPLSTAKTKRVGKKFRPTLLQAEALALSEGRSVSDILGEVDPSVAALTPAEAFDVAVQFAWALAAPVAGMSRQTMMGLDPRDLVAGIKLLKGYPETIRAMAGKHLLNCSEEPFFRRLSAVSSDRTGPVAAIMSHVSSLRTEHRGVGRIKAARVEQNLMTLTQLAEALKLERSLVKRMVDQKVFGEIPTRGTLRSYGWFSQSDLDRGRAFRDGRVGAQHWSRSVGLRHVYVRQLLALGLVAEPEPGPGSAVYDSLQLCRDSVDHFENSLKEITCYSMANPANWVRLPQVLKLIGGAHKPIGPILRAALSGSLPEGLRGERFRHFLEGYFVHRSVAEDIAVRARTRTPQLYGMSKADFGNYWPRVMSRTEAEEFLNCSPPDFSSLKAEGHLVPAPGYQTAVATHDVMTFGATYMSTREIAGLAGLDAKRVDAEMKRLGHTRHCGVFWLRQDVHGPDGILAAINPRRILAVWDAPQFGLPLQVNTSLNNVRTPKDLHLARFRRRVSALYGHNATAVGAGPLKGPSQSEA